LKSLYRWAEDGSPNVPKRAADPDHEIPLDEARDLGVSGASVESVSPRSRRRFTASEKLRIVKAADAAVASGERGAVQALLRKEGLYSSHLASWRGQLAAGGANALGPQKPGRKPRLDEQGKQLVAMTKRNAVLERKLKIANALISLQKQAHEILGIALPEHDDGAS
jgi:transposase-like protein